MFSRFVQFPLLDIRLDEAKVNPTFHPAFHTTFYLTFHPAFRYQVLLIHHKLPSLRTIVQYTGLPPLSGRGDILK